MSASPTALIFSSAAPAAGLLGYAVFRFAQNVPSSVPPRSPARVRSGLSIVLKLEDRVPVTKSAPTLKLHKTIVLGLKSRIRSKYFILAN